MVFSLLSGNLNWDLEVEEKNVVLTFSKQNEKQKFRLQPFRYKNTLLNGIL